MTRLWGPRPISAQTVSGSVVFGDVVQIAGVDGDVTISVDRPSYRVEPARDTAVPVGVAKARAQPSRLLLARHQVVPFTGRERTLDRLAAWAGSVEPVSALLVHGAGGQGKTRLAGEVAAQSRAAGWTVWQVTHTPVEAGAPGGVPASRADLAAGAVLVVADYADRWPASALLAMLAQMQALHARSGARVRVLLLARAAGYWWPAVADRADSRHGIDTGQLALPPLAADSDDDRQSLFTAAAGRFAAAMGIDSAAWPVPDLASGDYAQVLTVHMAALAAVDAHRHGHETPVRADAVSAYLLRREQAYWRDLHAPGGAMVVSTSPEVMHRAVVTATLTGVQPRPVARRALACTGFAGTAETADRIIDDHTYCYPPAAAGSVFEPLHPDRLGEDLIAATIPGHDHRDDAVTGLERDWSLRAVADLLTADGPPPAWTAAALTVLVETAHRWPHIATGIVYPLARNRPDLLVAAGGATLTRLAGLPGIDPAVLEAIEPLLPADRHIDLDIAAAAITGVLTGHRLAHTTDPVQQARLHAVHDYRLANAGRTEEALAPAEEAVSLYRRLAASSPDAHLPALATSLNNLGIRLSELGRREQALATAEEAATIRRRLAAADPDAYLPVLAGSLSNLGNHLFNLGRREQALAPAEEAVGLYRRLAESSPDAYLPELATSLHNLGTFLSGLGRREYALVPAAEAVAIRRRLADANPGNYLPDLAISLNNLGTILSELGRRELALAPGEEAVILHRRLAEANADAYLPDLARSLNNLATFLSRLGRHEQALTLAEEAVTARRRLAAANPDAYLPELAISLHSLGAFLSRLGRRDQALTPAEEAVALHRRLTQANPDAYLPDLAMSLNNLGYFLYELGRREQALAADEEAVAIRRRLAEANPDAYLPDLAESLNNLGVRLSGLGRGEEALTPAEDAVTIRRRLAEANPEAYLPDLAMSLWSFAWVCVNVRAEFDRALEAVDEAINLYTPLVRQLPAVFGGQLFSAYGTLADVLDGLDRAEEAAALRRQLDARGGTAAR